MYQENQTKEPWFLYSVRLVRATGSRVRSWHRSLRMSSPDLRRTLRPVQTRLLGSGAASRLQTLRVHLGRHAVPMRSSRSVSLQDRLWWPQVRKMCQRLLRLSEVSSLRLQHRRYNAVSRWCLRVRRQGTVSLQGETKRGKFIILYHQY